MSIKSLTEAYNILEVHSSASQSEVKSAYKRLALRTHPDKNKGDPSANAKFQQVTEAFQMVMNLRFEPVDSDDGEYATEVNAEDLFGENFANIIFRFVFSGSRRASDPSDSAKSACNCFECQFRRFFTEQKKEAESRKYKPPTEETPKNDATSSSAAPPSGNEGEAKAAGPVKGKKSSRKKRKIKKNTGAVKKDAPEKSEVEDCAETNPDKDSLDRPNSPHASSDSDVSSVSVSTAADVHMPPVSPAPPVSQLWKASPATSRRVQVQTAKKGAGVSTDLPSISTATNTQRAKKNRAPHTPTASYKPRTPRTPSSTASTHVGSYSVPSTPVQARLHSPLTATSTPVATTTAASAAKTTSDDRASTSPRKTVKPPSTKQPYANPNLPNLEGVQLCRIFLLKHGKCRFGDKCKFSHGVAPGTVLAASESEEGVFVSPSVSPTRSTPSSERTPPSPSPREPATVLAPVITLTPKVQRGTGRTQVAVNPSIGGFGRKSAPRPPPSQRPRTTRKSPPSSDPQNSNGGTQQRTQQGRGQEQTQRQVRGAVSGLPGRVKTNIYESAFGDSEESVGGLMTSEKGVCAFYHTPRGCKNGQNCRFVHK